jgi:hypothetical protein
VTVPVMAVAFVGLERSAVPHASILPRIAQQIEGPFGTAVLAATHSFDRTGRRQQHRSRADQRRQHRPSPSAGQQQEHRPSLGQQHQRRPSAGQRRHHRPSPTGDSMSGDQRKTRNRK